MSWISSGDRVRRSLTRRKSIKLAFSGLSAGYLGANVGAFADTQAPDMTRSVPQRAPRALTGSQFAEAVLNMDRQHREDAILHQLLEGNLPGFLKRLTPVELSYKLTDGKTLTATIFAMPEYLSIGSESDYLRIPMNLHTAMSIAERFGFVLPTKKIVDAIYDQATSQFTPQPLPAGPQMTSTEFYRRHNSMIDKQSRTRNFPVANMVSGHKKDVVITNRLAKKPGQIAIYGWHRATGEPIQPLSTVHGAGYADYSHGIRLVARMALLEGKLRSVSDILQDALFANILSDEGPIRVAPALGSA